MLRNFNELWPEGPKFIQEEGVFKLGSDSVLLSAFANMSRVKTVCDLGCGAGILPLLLLKARPELNIDAIELVEDAVKLAERNFALADVHVNLIFGDLRQYKELLSPGYYDLVISNPPYFQQNSGKTTQTKNIAVARDERDCTMEDVVKAASYLTRWGGRFAIVHRPERLSTLFCMMSKHDIEPKRLRMVHYKFNSAPSLVLVEGRRGGKQGLIIEPPLILSDENGNDSAEVQEIYRKGEP